MQAWTVPENAELLADLQLGSCAASTVAWCPVNGLLAVGARQHAKLACVHLISPHCLENRVTLAIPLQGRLAQQHNSRGVSSVQYRCTSHLQK